MLDTKGPEIRTAMLKGGQDISLSAGQEVLLVAVGNAYKTWEGGVDPDSGERGYGKVVRKSREAVEHLWSHIRTPWQLGIEMGANLGHCRERCHPIGLLFWET
jgi:hypothetical protein